MIGAERDAARISAVDGWPETGGVSDTLDIDKALAGRADVQAAQARVAAADKNRELARALRTRDVTASFQFDRTPWNPLANPTSANTIGFRRQRAAVHRITISKAKSAAPKSSCRRRATIYERVRALALGEIDKKPRRPRRGARTRAALSRSRCSKEAQKAADAAEFAYNRGAIGVMDLLDARRQLYATRLEASSTQADYAKSLAAWQAAIAAVEIRNRKDVNGSKDAPLGRIPARRTNIILR